MAKEPLKAIEMTTFSTTKWQCCGFHHKLVIYRPFSPVISIYLFNKQTHDNRIGNKYNKRFWWKRSQRKRAGEKYEIKNIEEKKELETTNFYNESTMANGNTRIAMVKCSTVWICVRVQKFHTQRQQTNKATKIKEEKKYWRKSRNKYRIRSRKRSSVAFSINSTFSFLSFSLHSCWWFGSVVVVVVRIDSIACFIPLRTFYSILRTVVDFAPLSITR